METEKIWETYFEASKTNFPENSDLENFKIFVEDSYSDKEIKKFLPRLILLMSDFNLDKSGTLIQDFLDFTKKHIYLELKEEPKKIFDFLKENIDKKDKNHIFDYKEAKELLISLHGEMAISFATLKELHHFFKISIRKIQKKLDFSKISSVKDLFTLMDINLVLLSYDTFIDWIVCNRKYLDKIIPLLKEQQMGFCIGTEPYNFYDKFIFKMVDLENFILKNCPEFL
jgi:hypothetical protein